LPDEVLRAHLPPSSRIHVLDGLGHFAHVEDPEGVAWAVLDFLANSG
jgi:pimeloyl-ACP methyl ester carboxylesterase